MNKIILLIFILLAGVSMSSEPDSLYAKYSHLLRDYVNDEGLVDYRGLSERDMAIKGILSGFSDFDHTKLKDDEERIAFWLNTYNLLSLEIIVDNYPIKSSMIKSLIYPESSIRQIPNAFAKRIFPFEGNMLSIDDIEHRILRKEFAEPRIHFALVCAAMDCPPLRKSAYRGDSLDAQLTEQATIFLNRDQNFSIEEQTIIVSEIFSWFGEDFKSYAPEGGIPEISDAEAGYVGYISTIMPEERDFILEGGYRITYTDYNWGLNLWEK